jgi:transposase
MNTHEPRSLGATNEQDGLMGRRCALVMDEVGRSELERLSRSGLRAEADRARAVLWSLAGESSAAIGGRLGVRAEQVRRWRGAVARDGVAALRSRPRPGRTPRKREAALAVAREVLNEPAADGPLWTLARLAREIEERRGKTISSGHLSVVLRKGAIVGAGHAIASRADRMPMRSTVPACGSGS